MTKPKTHPYAELGECDRCKRLPPNASTCKHGLTATKCTACEFTVVHVESYGP